MSSGVNAGRSAATRAKLLDATIDCLVTRGWAATSTTEIARRAGVSRGAQVHHFPSKDDLVLAAVEHLMLRRMEEFRSAFEDLAPAQRTHGAALKFLWENCFGESFEAWLKLAVAARSDEVLRTRLVELDKRLWQSEIEMFGRLFPEAVDDDFARVGLRLTLAVLNGLAVDRLLGVDGPDLDEIREVFALITNPFFPHEENP